MSMVTGKLIISKNDYNCDVYAVEYVVDGERTITCEIKKADRIKVSKNKRRDGMPVSITLQSNQVLKVEEAGAVDTRAQARQAERERERLLRERRVEPPAQNSRRADDRLPALKDATAPYNFIPYDPSKVITGLKQEGERYSGSITCTLTALTPLLVASESERDSDRDRTFFKVSGRETIPGASIKGMLRNLVEILSFSRLAPVNEYTPPWRDIKDDNYMKKFIQWPPTGNPKQIHLKVKTGYLYSEGADYYIHPCDVARVEQTALKSLNPAYNFKEWNNAARRNEPVGYDVKASTWGAKRNVTFSYTLDDSASPPEPKDSFPHGRNREGAYTLEIYYRKAKFPGTVPGEVVFTGKMQRKHMEFIFHSEDTNRKIPIPQEVFKRFEKQSSDEQMVKRKDCEGKYGQGGKGKPIFYLEAADKVESIGLAQMFRHTYAHSIKELLKSSATNDRDFAQTLFGTVDGDTLKGRIAVSHAECLNPVEYPGEIRTVLGLPRATCIPHYITQRTSGQNCVFSKATKRNGRPTNEFTNQGFDNFNNVNAGLRGFKRYWHKQEVEPVPPPDGNDNLTLYLHPLGPGSTFCFTVHVDGVTTAELGAIFIAIELWLNHAHKLGMGKSLGLGSVEAHIDRMKITTSSGKYLSLSNRMDGKTANAVPTKDDCKNAFMVLMLNTLNVKLGDGKNPASDYEKLLEIQHLRAMTDFHGKPSSGKTSMMPLQRVPGKPDAPCYAKKAILRTPLEIKGEK
jgi:CRISPR-associated protein (TIGR03986 family)